MQISVDLNKKLGKIKDMNATGQAPMGGGIGYGAYKHFHYLSEVSVPYVRLHDVGGGFAANRYVDVPNIFRDFDADENDPKNYDFAFTDVYIGELIKNGIKPYYRLGVTIENHAEIRSYRIDPPKDYEKWARICEHIIAHYNEGWADGFHYNIEYWEIWNEPDDGLRASQMWNGTAEDYYRLYDVASKHLKARFPNIKIGGYAAIGFYAAVQTEEELIASGDPIRRKYFLEFFHGFMKYIKEHNSPIDFFSWHSYSTPAKFLEEVKWTCEQLEAYGYGNVEKHINEWNPPCRKYRDKAVHGAEIAAIMLGCQNLDVDMLMIYDARIDGSTYSALFLHSLDGVPKLSHGYYTFAAFSNLYNLGTQVELKCDTDGVYAVAATNGKKNALMITNISGKDQSLEIDGVDLSDARWYLLDDRRLLSWSPEIKEIKNNTVVLVEF